MLTNRAAYSVILCGCVVATPIFITYIWKRLRKIVPLFEYFH